MKIEIAILVFGCIVAMAQDSLTSGGNFIGTGGGGWADEAKQEADRQKAYQAKLEYEYIPKDPWRVIDGQTNYAKGDGWVGFCGKVIEVQPNGIRIQGTFRKPPAYYSEDYSGNTVFFVAGFPYQVAENDIITKNYSAKEDGVYAYPTAIGGTSTIRKLDYGVPCAVPAELVEKAIQTAKAQADAKAAAIEKQKEESDKNAVKWLLTQVTNGDASAQCDLGERYLNGQGVETNRETAIYWLTQAANQGDMEASNKLSQLKSQ